MERELIFCLVYPDGYREELKRVVMDASAVDADAVCEKTIENLYKIHGGHVSIRVFEYNV